MEESLLQTLAGIGLAADSGMLAVIWLVQVRIYPGFLQVQEDRFIEWHRAYVKRISVVVIPLMLIQAACRLAVLYMNPTPYGTAASMAIAGAWIVTAAISAPCHRRLQLVGQDTSVLLLLIRTNWIRTILWTTVWLISVMEAFRLVPA